MFFVRYSLVALILAGFSYPAAAGPITGFVQTNLVSDISGLAGFTDPNLINPWGISFSATSPFWVSDNAGGIATLYNSGGTPQALAVTIPNPGSTGSPTGTVFNGTASFNGDLFLFATESGTIAGWRGALGTTAEVLLDHSGLLAVYTGLAIGSIGPSTYLYAADFNNNQISVLPGTGAPALSGNFVDPNLPAGYRTFNVQNIAGKLYVTYTVGSGADPVPGAGNGIVDVFNLDGTFSQRLITGGVLNDPWGLALAPAGFGGAGGDLLVGNFGDGTINAFDPVTGALVGTLADINGNLVNSGLWGLTFGNGGNGGSPSSLYFAAGINGEADGLFGRIDVAPEPGTLSLLVVGAFVALLSRRVGVLRG